MLILILRAREVIAGGTACVMEGGCSITRLLSTS